MVCLMSDGLSLTFVSWEMLAARPASSLARLTSLLHISLSPSLTTCQISEQKEDQ